MIEVEKAFVGKVRQDYSALKCNKTTALKFMKTTSAMLVLPIPPNPKIPTSTSSDLSKCIRLHTFSTCLSIPTKVWLGGTKGIRGGLDGKYDVVFAKNPGDEVNK